MIVVQAETVTFLTELGKPSPENVGLLFSFDGSSRGNPGKSSSGVCAWWGHFSSTGFEAMGLLIQKKGTCQGTSTNNIYEAHG